MICKIIFTQEANYFIDFHKNCIMNRINVLGKNKDNSISELVEISNRLVSILYVFYNNSTPDYEEIIKKIDLSFPDSLKLFLCENKSIITKRLAELGINFYGYLEEFDGYYPEIIVLIKALEVSALSRFFSSTGL